MDQPEKIMEFTGEFFIPGKSGERIELDHIERYRFTCNYVKNKAVLDIACGFGYAGPLLINAGALTYEGVDINKRLIENATSLFGTDKIKYFHGDICSYNSGKLFDIITCFETIEHIKNYRIALINLNSLLKEGGLLIISSPNRPVTSPNALGISDKPLNKYHIQEFTIKEFKEELTAAGFSVITKNIFGQRNSYLNFNITNKYLKRITQLIFGDPAIKSSPKVTKISYRIPRYIIIIACKVSTKSKVSFTRSPINNRP